MMTEDQTALYDFERVIENAVKAVIVAEGMDAFNSYDPPGFQSRRPRVDIMLTVGAGQKRFHKLTDKNVEAAWKGLLRFDVITGADMTVHSTFRARVRAAAHHMQVNGDALIQHNLQFFTESSTSPTFAPEDGTFQSVLLFDIDFSIQADAWAVFST